MELKLVKDFLEYQFVYYWVDEVQTCKVSPALPTLTHAQEWLVNFHFSQFTEDERRSGKFDRRKEYLSEKGVYGLPRSSGRRATDSPITVDFDHSAEKISELKAPQEALL